MNINYDGIIAISTFVSFAHYRSPDVTIGSDDGDDIFGDFPTRTK